MSESIEQLMEHTEKWCKKYNMIPTDSVQRILDELRDARRALEMALDYYEVKVGNDYWMKQARAEREKERTV